MINIRQQSGQERAYITEFIIDKEDEVANLPIFPQTAKGSTCLCIEDSSVYMLNGENQWVAI